MRNYIIFIIAFYICMLFGVCYGQTTSVSGKVLIGNAPAEAATVVLMHAKDSAIVKMALADMEGRYLFEDISKGSYKVRATSIGGDKYESNEIVTDTILIVLPDIVLQQHGTVLQEVGITATKALVEQKIDRTIVNVDAMISSAGLSALEVLAKSPGVQVDNDGKISLKGKQGVNVFIDGKATYLSGDDLSNYLKALPSSSLAQIEIMTNPPAKYDAAGNAGIINIKTKRTDKKGFNGGLTLGGNQGKLTRLNNSLNLNYRNNKISLFANLSYNLNNSFTDLDLKRVYKDSNDHPLSYFEQNTYFKRSGNAGALKLGMDYYRSDKTVIGVVFTGMARRSNQKNNNTSNLLNSSRDIDSIIVAQNTDDIRFINGGVNLNYRTQFDKTGHELAVDVDYLNYNDKTDQSYYNYSYLPDMTLKSQDLLSGKLPANINIYSFKADYTLPLMKALVFSAGAKSSYTHTDNTANYENTVDAITTPDYDKSNHFIYKEQINAAYINLSRETGKLSMQAGLRLENTHSDGHQLGNVIKPDSTFNRQYTNAFPTAYISYKFDSLSVNQIGLNYGRRIDRPYYQDLNPFVSPIDKFTYYIGNPFLKPSFTQSLQLSHTYKNRWTTSLSYSKSKDDVNETIQILDGIYYSMPRNIGEKIVKSLSIDADFDPTKKINVHLYSELTNIRSKSDFYNGQLSTQGTFWFISGTARWTLPQSWTVELSGNYRTKVYDAQFIISDLWQMNIAVQKKLSAMCTLRFGLNDVFYSSITNGVITNLVMAEASWRNRADSRNVSLSLSYRFGKATEEKRRHTSNGAESEQNRVKN